VDDNPVVRRGLRSILEPEQDILVRGEAATGEEALRQLQGKPFDVILLDIRLPDRDGVETAASILAMSPECKILMLTVVDDPSTLIRAILVGAKGYLVYGSFSPEELAPAIRTVYSGGAIITPSLASSLLDFVRENLKPGKGETLLPVHPLTEKEQRILELIALGKTNAEIARLMGIKEKTVKNHINNIYSKLCIRTRSQAIALGLQLYGKDITIPAPY